MKKLFKRKHHITWRTWAACAAFGVLLLGVPLAVYTLRNPSSSQAVWYDDTFAYRKKLTIGNTGSADTNKKVKFDIDTAALISATQLQSDCGDIRFTDQNGKQLLYYLDSVGGACNTNSTDLYVLAETILSGNTVFYMYYGNASAANGTQSSQFSQSTFSPTSGPTLGSQEKTVGPLAYWSFNDIENGQTVKDSSGNGYHGTLGASSSVSTDDPLRKTSELCLAGDCMQFDGSSDSVNVSTLSSTSQSYTISMWAKTGSAATTLKYLFDTQSGRLIFAWNSDSSGQIGFYDGSWHYFGAAPNDNKWHHLALVLDSGNTLATLYIDGQTFGSTSSYSGKNIGTSARIGSAYDAAGGFYGGSLDEVKLYAYPRTSAQVKADYVKGASAKGSDASIGQLTAALNDGLVGYWKMDETSANTCSGGVNDVCDASGAVNDGAWNGDATSGAGKFGSGLALDGTGDYVNAGNSSALNLTGDMSFSFWAKPNSLGTAANSSYSSVFIDRGTYQQNGYYVIRDPAGASLRPSSLAFATNQSGVSQLTETVNGALVVGEWHQYTITRKGAVASIYKDGVEMTYAVRGTHIDPTTSTDALLMSGYNADSTYYHFDGTMDEVRIYNRSLSPDEVRALYNWTPGPVTYLPMDEGNGQSAADTSGLGNSGTFGASGSVGADDPTWVNGKIGKAINLNGTSQFVKNTSPNLPLTSRSVSAWIKPTTLPSNSWVFYQADNGGLYWGLPIISGKVRYQFLSSGITATIYESSSAVITTGQWQHVEITHTYGSSTDVHIYVNGIEVPGAFTSTASGYNDPNLNGFQFDVGYDHISNASFFNGSIDDVKVYNYARSAAQVIEDMNAGHPTTGTTTPVGYWKLDEQQGQAPNNSGILGSTGNGVLGGSTSVSTDDPTWKTIANCKINGCLSFDGGDYVNLGNSSALNPTTEMTITAWIYMSSLPISSGVETWVVARDDNSLGRAYSFGVERYEPQAGVAGLDLQINGQATIDSNPATALQANTWYHIAAVGSPTLGWRLYTNGKQVASAAWVAPNSTTGNTNIGRRTYSGSNGNFTGIIDEVKIYNKALTVDELNLDMNANAATNVGIGTDEATQLADGAGSPPVGEWKFDENTGQSPVDTSGTGQVAVLGDNGSVTSDDPTWFPGKVGPALKYDGVDDHVTISDASNLTPTSSGFTVSAWVKYNAFEAVGSQVRGTIISKTPYNGSGSWEWSLLAANYVASVNPVFTFITTQTNGNTLSIAQDTTVVTTGRWYYVTGTVDNTGAARIYVDGVLKGTGSTAAFPSDTGTTLTVAAEYGSSNRWDTNGIIDDLKIYAYARTQAQIAYDYNRGRPVGWWKFDECQGTSANDSSGNGHTATITIGGSGTYTTVGDCQSGTATHAWYGGVTGKVNASIALDGTNDYVDIGNPALVSNATLTMWINPSAVSDTDARLFSHMSGATNLGGDLRLNATTVQYWDGIAWNNLTASGAISANQWTHLAIIYSPTNVTAYVNGKLQLSPSAASWSLTGNNMAIAYPLNGSFGNYYGGRVDDVRLYNYGLSASQVRKVMNGGAGVRFGPSSGQP